MIEDNAQLLPAIPPGEILYLDILQPMEISVQQFASDIDISLQEAKDLISGSLTITLFWAKKLSDYTGTSTEFWLNLQESFEEDLRRGMHVA